MVMWNTIIVAAVVLVALFILFGYVQAFIIVMTDYKKLGAERRSQLLPAVLLFPAFLILYMFTLGKGTVSKPKKWDKIKRNKIS